MWVLDFIQEWLHNPSAGNFENIFTKSGGSETKEGLKVKEVSGDSLGGAAMAQGKQRS